MSDIGFKGIASRRDVAGGLIVAGAAAFAPVARADQPQEAVPASGGKPGAIHEENVFAASCARIYDILLDSKEFSAMTGLAADISRDAGGAFSMFGGVIVGRNVELLPATRIVQAWKPKYWPPGVYSLVKFELIADGDKMKIVLDHTGFPDGTYDGLNSGWPKRYWQPLAKYLA